MAEEQKEESEDVQAKRVRVDNLLPGMVVAEDIKEDSGESLLGEGSELTEMTIKALFEKKIMKILVTADSYEKIQEESDKDGVEGVEFTDDELIEMGEEATREFLMNEEERKEELEEELRDFYKQLLSISEKNFDAIRSGGDLNLDRNRLRFVVLLGYLKDAPGKVMNLLRFRSKKNYLYSQSANATILALYLGHKMGYERKKQLDLGLGAMFHNLGMIEFEDVLDKETALTEAEKTMLQSHPMICEKELKNIDGLNEAAASVVFQHHERLDGSGFPKGLQFQEISELAAVSMVAIEFVELIQPRILANRISGREALAKIQSQSGSAFWDEPVEMLKEVVTKDFRLHSPGTLVELGDGEIAVVLEMTENDSKPIISVVVDADGRPLDQPKKLDLQQESQKYIDSVVHENIVEV